MRNVSTNRFPSAVFRSSATVRLKEEHDENWSRQFTIRYDGDYRTNVPLTHRFHIRHSAADDATYTLTYRLYHRSLSDMVGELVGEDLELGVYEYRMGVYDYPIS